MSSRLPQFLSFSSYIFEDRYANIADERLAVIRRCCSEKSNGERNVVMEWEKEKVLERFLRRAQIINLVTRRRPGIRRQCSNPSLSLSLSPRRTLALNTRTKLQHRVNNRGDSERKAKNQQPRVEKCGERDEKSFSKKIRSQICVWIIFPPNIFSFTKKYCLKD